MSKGGGTQRVTQTLDPRSQAYVDQMRRQAIDSANWLGGGTPPGMPALPNGQFLTPQMQAQLAQLRGSGKMGQKLAAQAEARARSMEAEYGSVPQIGGMPSDPAGMPPQLRVGPTTLTPEQLAQPFMNAYTGQVIDATRAEYDHMRGQASIGARQNATAQGAFGGNRAAILEGTRLGEIDRAQGTQIANLYSQAYQSALQQGIQWNEYQRALQEHMLQEPLYRRMLQQQFLQQSLGPTGGTQSTQLPPPNLFGQILGLGAMGLGAFLGGPLGAVATQGVSAAAGDPRALG